MKTKPQLAVFALTILLSACTALTTNPPELVPTGTPFLLPPTWTPPPVSSPTPAETSTPATVGLISIESTSMGTTIPPLDYEIPVFPGAQDVSHDFIGPGEPRTSVVYSVSAAASEVENFYKDKLAADGWIWVYTDSGESLTATLLSPSMIMEFQQDEHKLGIAIHGFGGSGLVLAGVDISGGELTMNFVGAVSGGLDWMGPSEIDTRPDAMHFSSTFLEFDHPFDWLVTDQLLEIYDTDKAVNYRPHTNFCRTTMEICFVNFLVGQHFFIPISIRVHPELAALTLEEADTQRWEELNLIAAAQERTYYFPEELAAGDSLESMEARTFTLADGTPAIQRMYRWKQEDVAEPIISTYTLFVSGDLLLEFHTDFTKEEWETQHATIDEVIAGIKTVP